MADRVVVLFEGRVTGEFARAEAERGRDHARGDGPRGGRCVTASRDERPRPSSGERRRRSRLAELLLALPRARDRARARARRRRHGDRQPRSSARRACSSCSRARRSSRCSRSARRSSSSRATSTSRSARCSGISAYLAGVPLRAPPARPDPARVPAGAGIGAACGIVNGAIVTVARVPSLVVTLGTLYVIRGIDATWAGGNQVNAIDRCRTASTRSATARSPASRTSASSWSSPSRSRRTRCARSAPAATSTRSARTPTRRGSPASRSGGACSRLRAQRARSPGSPAALWLSYFGSVDSMAGSGYEFQVIAAVVVGGVAIFGGSGTVLGAALGALLLNTINSALVVVERLVVLEPGASRAACCIAAIAFDRLVAAARRAGAAHAQEGPWLSSTPRPAAILRRAPRCAGSASSALGALLLVLLGATVAFGAHVSPSFLRTTNVFYIGLNVGEVAIMALPLALIVITGEIDLSVASMLGLSGRRDGRALLARLADLARDGRGRRRRRGLRRVQRLARDAGRAAVARRHDRDADALPRHRAGHPAEQHDRRLPGLA